MGGDGSGDLIGNDDGIGADCMGYEERRSIFAE